MLRGRLGGLAVALTFAGLSLLHPTAPAAESSVDTRLVAARTSTPVRVGSYNIRTVRLDSQSTSTARPWKERRPYVIRDIIAEALDVVGVQEASQNTAYAKQLVDGTNQYMDLRNGLRAAGQPFEVTDPDMYNCVNPSSNSRCVYRDQGASRDVRILYNTNKVRKVSSGAVEYARQTSGANDQRYLVWAIFEQIASGKRFFFATTHLAVGYPDIQQDQWSELIRRVKELNNGLPTIVAGDFQRAKMAEPATTMMREMKAAGWGDVVGQTPGSYAWPDRRPESLSRAWVNSMNKFDRNVANWSFENKRTMPGNNPDWIFASNDLAVKSWRVRINMDPTTLRLRGVIPSDHNLVRAVIALPAS